MFRPVGLEMVASVIREATNQGIKEKEAIKRVANIPMDLADEPWVGLLWDKTNQRMLTESSKNKKIAKQLLLYRIGGDLTQIGTNLEKVRHEYAGLLNRDESEIELQQQYTSLL